MSRADNNAENGHTDLDLGGGAVPMGSYIRKAWSGSGVKCELLEAELQSTDVGMEG